MAAKKKAPAKKAPAKRSAPRRAASAVKTVAKKARRRVSGAVGGAKGAKESIMQAGIAIAGAIAVSMLMKKVPLPASMAKIAPFAPLMAGLGISMLPIAKKNPMVRNAALGAMVVGGLQALKTFPGTASFLSGDDQLIPMELEQAAMLGWNPGSQQVDLGTELRLGDDDDTMEGDDDDTMEGENVGSLMGDDDDGLMGDDGDEWRTGSSVFAG